MLQVFAILLLLVPIIFTATPSASLPVIVIGSGPAGAGAARRLAEKNIPVVVLEARNRFGGRVWTDRTTLGVPADMGAGWIHGPTGNPLTALQQQYQMKIYQTNDDALTRYRSDGVEFANSEYSPSETSFNTFKTNIQAAATSRINNGQADISLETLMATADNSRYSQEDIQWHIGSNIEFDYGAPAILMSGLYYNSDSKFEGKDVLFPDGYDAMISGLLNTPTPITVRYNTVVTAVNYTNDVVMVYTNQGIYNASKVICTIPLGVLKANDVVFTPELPQSKKNSISALKMGFTNKVFLVFPNTFWPNSQQYFGIMTGATQAERGLFNYWLNANAFTNNANVLVTFGLGTAGAALDGMSESEIRNRTMAILGKMFKVTIPQPTKILVTRWASDPYAKGAYSYCALGAKPDDFDSLAAPVGSNLYFAGEHTSKAYRGTVHGALISGRAAADAIAGTTPSASKNPMGDGTRIASASSLVLLAIMALIMILQ